MSEATSRSSSSHPPVALTIAGSDSGGGAGIQADLKTFAALHVFGASAITAITAQNTQGVRAALMLEPGLVEQQIGAVADDLAVRATKTGMLGNTAIIEAVADAITRYELRPLVVDPVMVAKSGDALIDDSAVSTLVARLLPLATIVTPNRHEAARLLGLDEPILTDTSAAIAAQRICERLGARACVIKAIPREHAGVAEAVDVFFDGKHVHDVASPRQAGRHTHGSGCAYSAAITAALAHGESLLDAVYLAKRFIDAAIADYVPIGHGIAPVNPLAWLPGADERGGNL